MTPDPRDAYALADDTARDLLRPVYRHTSHLEHAPTAGQRVARAVVGTILAAVAVLAVGLVGASDVDTACTTADPATSSVCTTP